MRVVLDAHMLGAQEGGNETYVAGLIQGLTAITMPTDTTVTALHDPAYCPHASPTSVRYIPMSRSGNIRRLLIDLPRACHRTGADVLHVTYNAPLLLANALVVSVHDVIYRRYPRYFSPQVRLLLNTVLPLSMRRAQVILTISETSRRDIEHFYPFTRGRVVVVPIAAGSVATVTPNCEAALRYSAGHEFILAVGTIQPRKNITRLINAYIAARQRGKITARLIVVGKAAWQHSEIQQVANASLYRDDVMFTGYLDDATVAGLYQTCAAFVYPSLYEGFGLPVLEAMACGAPVITSQISSMPEVAGDAAIMIDPYRTEQIVEAIEGVLSNRALQADLRARGQRQAALFTWERTATETLAVYRQAMQKRVL
ncbi:glycosyltransferase family 4 protein [Chloroflexales bacterium ZM16-3]|nr:glycosyltransferase family 4 protein [Chloroflexales bacterium ZM16-3]